MADNLATPEVGQVISDPAQFVQAGQFLSELQVKNLPIDFQAKAFVNAQVFRDGSVIHVSQFQPGDIFRGWSSGIAVSHKDDQLANDGGLAGVLRNPLSTSLDDALDQAHVMGPVSLNRDQRDSLFLSMKNNAYFGALDYLKPLEHWAMGSGLSIEDIRIEQTGQVVPAERMQETIGDAPGAKTIAELAGRGAAIGGEGVAPRQGPKQPSPMGGLDMAGMAEGATLLYSRADSPETLRTGVLLHNEGTANGQRLEILNDQGLRERVYTGPDQGNESPHNRLAAVVGHVEPTSDPVFVAGVGADGRINDKDPQSFGVFRHDADGNAVPVGQAVTRELAEHLQGQVNQNRVPEPVDAPQTVSSLSQLRDMLDLPPAAPEVAAEQKTALKQKDDPQAITPEQKQEQKDGQKQEQQQVVHHHHTLMSLLLMHTINAGKTLAKVVKGPDAEEYRHRAHANLDRAQAHVNAIAAHPAVQQYQAMDALPNMPEQAKKLYAETILRNHPELSAHYKAASESVGLAHDAMFLGRKKDGATDPALLEKARKVQEIAGTVPNMGSSSSGLFASLKSLFETQQQPARASQCI